MHPTFAAILFGVVCTAGLGACASFEVVPAEIDVVPTQYPLSPSDIRALQRLPLAVGITKPVRHIQAQSANQVYVTCGEPWLRDAQMISFTARRKNEHWFVDKSSINKFEPIILE
jgi:hypothetical protein